MMKMMRMRNRYSGRGWRVGLLLVLLCSNIVAVSPLCAQTEGEAVEAVEEALAEKKVHFFNGVAVGADLCGLGMKIFGCDWSQLEVLARINIYDKYFPIFEMGLGMADHTGRDIDNRFSVRAPYFRIGADYNINKKHNGNRLFIGLRYAFSAYNYDIDSPVPLEDPVWRQQQPVALHSLHGNSHWAEVVLGLETKIWTIVRLGWDLRFKVRFAGKNDPVGTPWYTPGFGKSGDTTCLGGSFKILFDI